MLKIGAFISSLFTKNRQILIYAYQNNYQQQLSIAQQLAKQHSNTQLNLVINLQGNHEIENMDEIIQKKPGNLHIKLHPSNRKIEIHLLLLQFLTKNQRQDYWLITHQAATENTPFVGTIKQSIAQHPALLIKTEQLIKHYLNHINQLRPLNALINP